LFSPLKAGKIAANMDTTSFAKKTISGVVHIEPALTPPSMKSAPAAFPAKPKLDSAKPRTKKRDIPEGLWTKCPSCGTMIYDKELDENLKVCPKCQHHFPIGSRERIHSLVETCTFEEMDAEMSSVDMLKFASYRTKLERDRKNTMLKDAVVTGVCRMGGHQLALGVMDFGFMGGSMGSVVGEKLTRLIERATEGGWPVIIISTSGGARMQEGVFSLMQMAKTSAALAYHAQQRLPYISVLTNNSYGGVMASYAALGDLILAEPAAMIGFAGPRVIKDTTHAELPPGFQTAEFLLEHGLVDAIVPRKEMKEQLVRYLDYFTAAKKNREN
jgi:acetyl-CoA carboxylase carboxyl transferase subunit beta